MVNESTCFFLADHVDCTPFRFCMCEKCSNGGNKLRILTPQSEWAILDEQAVRDDAPIRHVPIEPDRSEEHQGFHDQHVCGRYAVGGTIFVHVQVKADHVG